MKLERLHFWKDSRHQSAARNMALDQALFEHAATTGIANLRLYEWDVPTRTVGYFHRFGPGEQKSIRRFTGGGIVDHGEDLTFVLNLPNCAESTAPLYNWIHQTIVDALSGEGFQTKLETNATVGRGGDCFAQPVASDILDSGGKKVGGGAQRRSRGSVIHQGSIRLPLSLRDPHAGWIDRWIGNITALAEALAPGRRESLDKRAGVFARDRYDTVEWNRWR